MSREIDERVVEMRFNNKQFEEETKKTMSTLDRLKEALSFTKSGDSLKQFDKSVSGIKLDGIAAGVEMLTKRFSTFGIIGMQVVQNITNALTSKLSSAIGFVSDSIISGGTRRAMNIENAHFQLQALLKDEEKVQAVMDDAMVSVDGTAYAYDEAAKAASQFSASGLKAGKDMQMALRGIVGVAAMTNSEYESISNIFTTVAGNGRLMGDQLLQLSSRGLNAASTIATFVNGVNDGSKKTTKNVKEAVKAMTNGLEVTEGDIRDFVSDGEISFEIFSAAMTEAFADSAERANETFTGAFSNMKSALARIGAEFISPLVAQNSEVVKLFNALRVKINDVKASLTFSESMKNTNALSKVFTDSVLSMAKAATEFIEKSDMSKPMAAFYSAFYAIRNVSKGLYSVISPIGKAFSEVFLSFNSDDVIRVISSIERLTRSMKLSDESSKNLHDAFKGVFDVIGLLGDGFFALLSAIMPIQRPITSISGGFLDLAGSAGRSLSSFTEFIRKSGSFSKFFSNIGESVESVSDILEFFVNKIRSMHPVENIINGLSTAFEKLSGGVSNAKTRFKPFSELFLIFLKGIKNIGSGAVSALDAIGDGVEKIISAFNKASRTKTTGTNSVLDLFNAGMLIALGTQLSNFIATLVNSVATGKMTFTSFIDFAKIVAGNVNRSIKNVADTLEIMQKKLSAETLKEIAAALLMITASVVALSMIDSDRLTASIGAVSILIGELVGILKFMTMLDTPGLKRVDKTTKAVGSLIAISIAIDLLASAMKKMGSIDSDNLAGVLFSVMALVGEMAGVMVLLSRYGGKVKTNATAIVAFSAAIYILSKSVESLGGLDFDTLTKGLTSVGILLGELAAFMFGAKFGKLKFTQSLSIIALAEALLILQEAVSAFGKMNTSTLIVGLLAVGGILTEISAFSLATGQSKHMLSTAVGVIAISKALQMLEEPMTVFGKMSIAQLAKGLLAMGVALGEISAAVLLLPKDTAIIGAGLYIMAMAIGQISEVMMILGGMSISEIAKGLISLGGSLGILAAGAILMSGTLSGSAAMFVMATALSILVPSLKTLGEMGLGTVIQGLIALGGAFVVIGAAGYLLAPVIPSIFALAAAMALIGVASAAFGAGVLAVSIGLSSLAVSGVASAAALVEAIQILVVGFFDTIKNSATAIKDAFVSVVLAACDAVKETVPTVVETLLTVIEAVLTSLADHAPEIVSQLIRFITGILDALAADMPTLVTSVVELFMSFFQSVIDALNGMDTGVLEKGIIGIGMIAALMAALSGLAALCPGATLGVIAAGITIAELTALLTAIGAISLIPGLSWIVGKGGDFLALIGEAIGGFIGSIVASVVEKVSAKLPQIGSDLTGFMENAKGFLDGAAGVNNDVLTSVKNLVAAILAITAADVVNSFMSWLTGKNSIESFGEQLLLFGDAIAEFGETVSGLDAESVKAAAAAGELLAGLAEKLPKTGGLAQAIFGETTDMATFGEQLTGFGDAIVPFCDAVKDVNPKSVEGAVAAGEILAGLAKNLPTDGGLKSAVFGETTDIDDFGVQLLGFGDAIVPFCDAVKDISPNSVMGAAMAANVMSNIAKNLPKDKNIFEKWFGGGTMTLSKFGEELTKFGPYIVSFSESVRSIKATDVSGAMASVAIITSTMKSITNDNYSAGSLKKFGAELEKFGASLKKFYKEMASADFSKINTITANIKKLSNAAKEAGTESMNSFVKGINSNSGSVVTAMRGMIETVIEALNKTHARFTANGKIAGKKFIDGIHAALTSASNISRIKTAGNTLGKNYAEGLANGIKNNTSLVTAAARSMAAKADQEVSKVLDEHSPSKLAEKRGKWYDEGLAIGLRKSAKLVAEEAGKLGGVVNASLTNSLAKAGPLSLHTTIKSLAELDKELKIEKMAKAINKHIAEISLSLYGLSKPAKEMADAISNGFSSMTSTVAKANENISKLQKEYEAQQKKLEKEQEAQQKREEELQEEYEKWVDYYSKTKKERAEAAKEAKKQAAIEAKAYAKTYGGLKTAQVKAIDFTDEYYEKLLKITRTGNNKLLYEDKSLEEAKIDILQRITDAYQSYLDSYTQTQQSFMDQIGFFDKVAEETQSSVSVNPFSEVTKNEAKTKEELFQIANDQITLYTDFVDTQTRLLERIGDTGLGDYIRELGVDSYEQLQVLNTMTEEELQLYAQAYDRTYEAISKTVKETDVVSKESLLKNARDQVKVYEEFVKTQSEIMARLQGTALGDYVMTLGIDQKDEMDAILSMTDAELNEYVGLYDQKFAMSGVAAKNQLSKTQAEIEQSIVDILQGVVQKVNLWEWDFDGSIESIIGSVKKTTKKAKKGIDKVLTSYASALASNMNASIGTPIGTAIAAGMSAKQLETAISKSGKQNDPVNVVKKTVEASGDKNKPVAETKGKELAQSGVTGVKKMQSSFYDAGQKAGQKVAEGLRSQTEAVRSAAAALQAAASAAATSAGASTGSGFASGVKSTASAVVGASIGIGAGAVSALKGSLKIHSPSKVTEKLGDYTVLGFLNALMQGVAKVAIASEELGDAAKDGMETGLDDISKVFTDSDLDVTPVIQPIVDLSGVEQSIRDITRMFNDAIQVVSANVEVAADVMRLRTKHTEEADRGSDGEPVVNNYTFNQTNNSPKALSSIDIYRSTNNQFAQFREAVSRA